MAKYIFRIFLVSITVFLLTFIFSSNEIPATLLAKSETLSEKAKNEIPNKRRIIIIDYQRSIFEKRLWVWNTQTRKVELHCRVSHAKKSGWIYPTLFSNTIGSKLSCTGIFVTSGSYTSNYGKGTDKIGMRINGLEKGKNDNAYNRNIVFHSGKVPYSEGCFMTMPGNNKRIIDLCKNGSLLFVHY